MQKNATKNKYFFAASMYNPLLKAALHIILRGTYTK
jgi:hypothetical protein